MSDLSARILPGLLALGSIFFVYRLGGFVSALALILTPRFIKYGADFYLDGPLAFWMIFYAFFALKQRWKGMAIGLAAAFLTKGLVALVLPVATLALVLWDRKKNTPVFLKSLLGALALLAPWLLLGNGFEYLRHYWNQSVAGRTRAENGFAHLQPLLHLLLVYFPFWIALGFGYARAVTSGRKDLAYLALNAFGVVAGFSIVGHFYEHYFLPFYVFAAPVAGFGIYSAARLTSRNEARLIRGTAYAAFAILFLNFLPISIHHPRNVDLGAALRSATQHCQGIRNVHVATDAQGLAWPEMAFIQWKTPWQTVFDTTYTDPNTKADPHGILITAATPSPAWKKLATFGALSLFEPKTSSLCPELRPN